ncbi:hypothetical protein SAMN05443634_106107 [Chishuiella changwenlii]|uniref:Uncharacterized protein n=1 Tax=Chishuiella changwenlii TaxID=1434701 RepID=A0A1M6Y671_9FLAO|nr:hypothetical protein SAMN05443634_106107 [Chishuiella changwenlii]
MPIKKLSVLNYELIFNTINIYHDLLKIIIASLNVNLARQLLNKD